MWISHTPPFINMSPVLVSGGLTVFAELSETASGFLVLLAQANSSHWFLWGMLTAGGLISLSESRTNILAGISCSGLYLQELLSSELSPGSQITAGRYLPALVLPGQVLPMLMCYLSWCVTCVGVTCGDASSRLRLQASSSMRRFLRCALKASRGKRMACWRSRLMTTRMKAEACMANSFRKQSSLQSTSPPYHCTVTFQTASRGITTNVIIRSADARLSISGRRWDARRRPRPRHTLTNRARLLQAANRKRTKVAPTRNWAAQVKLGGSQSDIGGYWEVLGDGRATWLVGGARDDSLKMDQFRDILQRRRRSIITDRFTYMISFYSLHRFQPGNF